MRLLFAAVCAAAACFAVVVPHVADAVVVVAKESNSAFERGPDPLYVDPSFADCKWQRSGAIDCAQRYLDLNGDEYITRDEIEAGMAKYLTTMERTVVWLAKKLGLEDTDTVLRHCDLDNDGRISRSDFLGSTHTCIATCERVGKFFHFICDRAEEAEHAAAAAAKHNHGHEHGHAAEGH